MNDLSMFEEFSCSFAPMNAEERIKELAHYIVSDCEEDGFAEAIDMILKVFKRNPFFLNRFLINSYQ